MDTYNDIFLRARRKLRGAGVEAFDLEARLIVAHASGRTREDLLRSSRLFVPDSAISRAADEMIDRRLAGEPVAYIVGEWEFFSLPVIVNDSVLIPRTDTEVLAAETIKLLRQLGRQTRILDLCAGSGCVGLAVAANVPSCRIVLADSSDKALAVCRANMLRNNLSRNMTAIEADVLDQPPALLGSFDAIVSNPPYIPTADLIALDPSVRDYEPVLSLDGGPDGLYFFRAIVTNWTMLLKQDGFLSLECGAGQAPMLREIMRDGGLRDLRTFTDTLGIERVVIGTA